MIRLDVAQTMWRTDQVRVNIVHMTTLLLVGAGVAFAALAGSVNRAAKQAARDHDQTRARVPVLKEARNNAEFRAVFWILAVGLYLLAVLAGTVSGD